MATSEPRENSPMCVSDLRQMRETSREKIRKLHGEIGVLTDAIDLLEKDIKEDGSFIMYQRVVDEMETAKWDTLVDYIKQATGSSRMTLVEQLSWTHYWDGPDEPAYKFQLKK